MANDPLSLLLTRFRLSARLFFSGALCNTVDFPEDTGFVHVIKRGRLEVRGAMLHAAKPITITEPTLLFCPAPTTHRFIVDPDQPPELACASVRLGSGAANPVAQALPRMVLAPLARLPGLAPTVELLFAEALSEVGGRQAVLDRLFEVLLIQLLRIVIADGATRPGALAGLAHPQLAKAILALHGDPARDWTLEALAASAGMSRTSFAEAFRTTAGATPGDYLRAVRVALAQDLLRRGKPLKNVAYDVGYGSAVALSRAFKARVGVTPREWRKEAG